MDLENASTSDNLPDRISKNDVPAECAEFERLLAIIASDFGEAKKNEFDEVTTASLRKLVQFIRFDRGTVMMFSEDGTRLMVTHCWASEGIPLPAREELGEDLWYTHQIRCGHIVRISTAADWPTHASFEREYVADVGLKSTISIPLMISGKVIGVLAFGTFHEERPWSLAMVSRLRLVGEIFALGIRRHQDAEALSRLARSADQQYSNKKERMRRLALGLMHAEHLERYRIGELLHEDVMQILALGGMYIESSREGDSVSAAFSRTSELIRSAVDKLRSLAMELRCEALSKSGLVEGLHWLAKQMLHTSKLRVEIKVRGGIEPVSQDIRLFLYRAASELLENVARHAQTTNALLEIWRADDMVGLKVSDEGIGFEVNEPEPIPSKSFGLFSISEQADLLGGGLEVSSQPGHGTRATLTVPEPFKRETEFR